MDKLDPSDPRAPYLQVADLLRQAIETGEYVPGAKLPGYDAVAEQFGVARGTVRRAYSLLQSKNLIVVRHGQGSFVRPPGEDAEDDDPRLAAIYATLDDFGRRLAAIEQRIASDKR